jgi:hypothetical protein
MTDSLISTVKMVSDKYPFVRKRLRVIKFKGSSGFLDFRYMGLSGQLERRSVVLSDDASKRIGVLGNKRKETHQRTTMGENG